MSLGYAEKLSYIEDVGNVGMTEYFDESNMLQEKIEQLAKMIHKSKHLVAFTGAGISTSCGIPDFRGPNGIWTLQREGKPIPEASLPFHRAMPSITHMALVELEKVGILQFVISQNVDGLHLRSGIPREKLSELHGNSFMENCPSCRSEYLRDFEVETIGLKETSRFCSGLKCGARLKDSVLDWEDALPTKEMLLAEKHCKMADLVLCLGTSLQITPACNLPLRCLRGGGKIVIVNLQKTPKDKKASLVIHGFVDKVIAGVMSLLMMPIPPFVRIDLVQIIMTQSLSVDERYLNWNLRLASSHGPKLPISFVKSVEVAFSDSQKYKPATLTAQPFNLKRRTALKESFHIFLKFNLSNGCGCQSFNIAVPFGFEASKDDDNLDKDSILESLKQKTLQESSCGQNAVTERKETLIPATTITTHAIVTNIKHYRLPSSHYDDKGPLEVILNGCGTRKRSHNRKRKSVF